VTTLPILPFPIRTVAAVSSFPCIYIAAPGQGAPLLPGVTGPQRAAMALQYAQITQSYQLLLNQDTGPNQTSIAITYPPAGPIEPLNSPNAKLLESIINSLVIAVGNLVTTLNAIVVTNAAAVAPPYSTGVYPPFAMSKADAQNLLNHYTQVATNALTQLKAAYQVIEAVVAALGE
jgi:hypothetical protein